MNGWGRDLLSSLMMGFLIPGVILNTAVTFDRPKTERRPESELHQQTTLPVRIRSKEGSVQEGEMDDYLVGVVLAEMPAYFESEALRAQAVVARTFAGRAYETGGKHGDSSVCVLPECCQGYRSESDYLEQGGREADVEKVRQAVLETSGQVLVYGGELIEATYFSCSGGSTEDALTVWGTAVPYLRTVESPGEEQAAHYRDRTVLTARELEEKLELKLPEHPGDWFGKITYTAGGSVDTAVIGGQYFTGTEVRSRLGLHSAAFTVSLEPEGAVFITKGYGHRVGMSQYGADAMAAAGNTYQQILTHYYQGTELTALEELTLPLDKDTSS